MKILMCICTLLALDLVVEAYNVIPPLVTNLYIDTDDHKAYLGTTFNLSCTVNFNPSVKDFQLISFFKNGTRVFDKKGKYENFPGAVVNGALRTRKLTVKNATKAEEGKWSCYGVQREIEGDFREIYVKLGPCPAGYYCPWNESQKHECPYGTYSDGSTTVTYQCTKCPGEYPDTKAKDSGPDPAKSIEECPKKDQPGLTPLAAALIVFIPLIAVVAILVPVVMKYNKQCKRFLRKFISVNCLFSDPE